MKFFFSPMFLISLLAAGHFCFLGSALYFHTLATAQSETPHSIRITSPLNKDPIHRRPGILNSGTLRPIGPDAQMYEEFAQKWEKGQNGVSLKDKSE